MKQPCHDMVRSFREDRFKDQVVVGVHVRHGNAEQGDFKQLNREIKDLGKFLSSVLRCGKDLARADREVSWFLCTDSDIVIDEMRRLEPAVITREQWRPERNSGLSLHLGHQCPEGEVANAANALVDIYLLSYCDYLAIPAGPMRVSWFVHLASKLRGYRGLVHFNPFLLDRMRRKLRSLVEAIS